MGVAWGIVVVALSLVCWGGQAVAHFATPTAIRLGLSEAEEAVEPVYWADIRAEALWDTCTLWTLVVAGVLLVAGVDAWAYFGLVGGGMYIYFAGRGILARREMVRRGLRVGSPLNVTTAFVFLTAWGLMGLITVAAAAVALS